MNSTDGETTGAITTENTVIETPASEFEYSENEDGTITIKKYNGSAADIVIPQTIDNKPVTRIDNGCFGFHQSLNSVKLPESIKEIGGGAFAECRSLKAVTLPSSLTIIGNGAFQNCSMLSEITLPNTLTEIGYRSFANCSNLKEITIPSSVVTLGEESFCDSGLERIQINEGIETIPSGTFAGTNIRELVLPSTIKTIGFKAFYYCKELRSVSLNEGLVTVDPNVFQSCVKLTEIVIPQTVTTITDIVFDGCESLKKVYFEGNAPENYIYGYTTPSPVSYTVYYHENATGFTAPEWNGYPTQIW